jgi:hypothetical protein
MEGKFNMTTRQKVVFGCLQAPHAQNFLLSFPIDGLYSICHQFLLSFPIDGLYQHMSPVEYRTILKYQT